MAEKAVATELGTLNPTQTAKLAEFGSELQQSALENMGTMLDKKLEIAGVSATTVAAAAVAGQFSGMFLTVNGELRLDDGTTSQVFLLIGEDEAAALFNVDADAADDDYKAKLEEAVQTALSDLTDFLTLSISVNSGAQLQFGVSSVELRNLAMTPLQLPTALATGQVLQVVLPVTVDGGPAMEVTYLMGASALNAVVASVDPSLGQAAAPAPAANAPRSNGPSQPQPVLTPLPTGAQESHDSVVRPAQFTSFSNQADGSSMANIDLILDVQLRVTVELGRKLMSVRDILALGPGSVVELDKVAGEPVDVLVNDRLIATGEVVVADDNFGVRITDIVNPAKRLSSR